MKKTSNTLVSLFVAACVACAAAFTLVVSFIPRHQAVQPEPVETQTVQTQDEQQEAEQNDEQETQQDDQRNAFVSTWAARIDAFNAGYPLEGYGATFAEAAYDYGIDPRFSPAIARVESGSGANCTYACNAWGWGSSSWGDWGTAIYAHVAGLAANYGTTLSYGIAQTYNEENPDEWYAQVEQCMYQIWESDSI